MLECTTTQVAKLRLSSDRRWRELGAQFGCSELSRSSLKVSSLTVSVNVSNSTYKLLSGLRWSAILWGLQKPQKTLGLCIKNCIFSKLLVIRFFHPKGQLANMLSQMSLVYISLVGARSRRNAVKCIFKCKDKSCFFKADLARGTLLEQE